MSEQLLARLEILEAKEAIRDLIAAYARVCDTGFNGAAMAALFTEDGVWEGNFGVRCEGRQQIAAFFDEQQANIPFALHFYTNISTIVDGHAAQGRCLLLQSCTMLGEEKEPTGQWMTGDYLNDFVFADGRWAFKHVRLNQRFRSNFTEDWKLAPLQTTTLG